MSIIFGGYKIMSIKYQKTSLTSGRRVTVKVLIGVFCLALAVLTTTPSTARAGTSASSGPPQALSWAGWTAIPHGATYDAPALATVHGTLYTAVRGTDNRIYTNSFNGTSWAGWTAIPNGATYDAPALAIYYGTLYTAVRGTDNRIYTNLFNGTSWAGWTAIPNGFTLSAPALAIDYGTLYTAVRGTDNRIYTNGWS